MSTYFFFLISLSIIWTLYVSCFPNLKQWYNNPSLPKWKRIVRRTVISILPSLLFAYLTILTLPNEMISTDITAEDVVGIIEPTYTIIAFILTDDDT